MRRIKFRGKTLRKGANGKRIWVCGDLITTSDERAFIFPIGYDLKISNLREEYGAYSAIPVLIEVDPKTVGQLLAIINGQEIYEGDIVKADYGLGYPPQKVDMETFYWYYSECAVSDNIEVIGNVYDNPELLEEKNVD